jgi:hypothetical protein
MNVTQMAVQMCLAAVTVIGARAEKVQMSPESLKKTATHVVVGEVTQIYERKVTDKDWNTTYYVAEVQLKEVEKGDGIEKGGLVYIRYWRRAWAGEGNPPPNTAGHRGLPKSGETLRIYMSRNAYDGFGTTNDGGFNVIGANGFERLKD